MEPQKLFADLDSPTLEVVELAKSELLKAVSKIKDCWLVSKVTK